jgi:hypothetical protein
MIKSEQFIAKFGDVKKGTLVTAVEYEEISGRVDMWEGNLEAEEGARISGDSVLDAKIATLDGDLTADITAEAQARAQADTAETAQRTQADNALGGRIDAEDAAWKAADAALDAKKQNLLQTDTNIAIDESDPLRPKISALVVPPDPEADEKAVAGARAVGAALSAIPASNHARGTVLSAYTRENAYTADVVSLSATGLGYQPGDSIQFGLDIIDLLLVVTGADPVTGAITAFNVSSSGWNSADFAGNIELLGGHGTGARAIVTTKVEGGPVLADVPSPQPGDQLRVKSDETHSHQIYDWHYADYNGDGVYNWVAYGPSTVEARNFFTDPITPAELNAAGDAAPLMDGEASAGEAATVSRSDHRHPTDTSRASTETATDAADGLMSADDKGKLDTVAEGAQPNPPVATAEQAEEGTDDEAMMTPLKTFDAIEAWGAGGYVPYEEPAPRPDKAAMWLEVLS